jgi:protein-disulfide isomerase
MTDPVRVTVLVSASCAGCAQASALARQLQAQRPDVDVVIVDVNTPGWKPPILFSGTPMFYLGGNVLSYGNPTMAQLLAALPEVTT